MDNSGYPKSTIKDENHLSNRGGGGGGTVAQSPQLPLQTATGTVLRTPAGNVRPLVNPAQPPPLPAVVPGYNQSGPSSYLNSVPGYRNTAGGLFAGGTPYGGYGGMYGGYGGAYGGYGNSYYGSTGAGYGYRGYAGDMYGGVGGLYSNSGAFEPEARFIQMAEESTKSAFESIESLVMTISNIAAMLDSTFFALTSSFRAVLGVAANFGRLRGVFSQFWHSFFIFRGIIWIYRKLLYWLRLSKWDPSSAAFKEAFAEALNAANAQRQGAPPLQGRDDTKPKTSPWPVVLFISFILTAPYLIMKLLGNLTNTAQEEARNPSRWVRPIETTALYDFEARHQSELSIYHGQRVWIAPKEIQNTLRLLNTGWAMAAIDLSPPNGYREAPHKHQQKVGLIPINYVKSPQQMRMEQEGQQQTHSSAQFSAPQAEN